MNCKQKYFNKVSSLKDIQCPKQNLAEFYRIICSKTTVKQILLYNESNIFLYRMFTHLSPQYRLKICTTIFIYWI